MKRKNVAYVACVMLFGTCIAWPTMSILIWGKDAAFNLKDQHVVEKWLESQRRGEPGTEYWFDGVSPPQLFAVRSWEFVDHTWVRIESSTKGGIPVSNLWDIKVVDLDFRSIAEYSPKIISSVNLADNPSE